MAAGDGVLPPMVVSSNRFSDIRPYCDVLYHEDPQQWGQIMPWDFPQNGSKETEEAFLRKYFTESEIHVQGGEPDGFRFLKQVWYTIAIYNWQIRVPLVVDQWFRDRKEILGDAQMVACISHPDVNFGTLFDAAEIEMYGEKFLRQATKAVQYRHQHPEQFQPAQLPRPGQDTDNFATQQAFAAEIDSTEPVPQPAEPRMPPTEVTGTVENTRRASATSHTLGSRTFSSDQAMNPTVTHQAYRGMNTQNSGRCASSEYAQLPRNRRGFQGKRSSYHDRPAFNGPPPGLPFAVGPEHGQPHSHLDAYAGLMPRGLGSAANGRESDELSRSVPYGRAMTPALGYGPHATGANFVPENAAMHEPPRAAFNAFRPQQMYGQHHYGGVQLSSQPLASLPPFSSPQGAEEFVLDRRRESIFSRGRGGRNHSNTKGRGNGSRSSNNPDHHVQDHDSHAYSRKVSVSGEASGTHSSFPKNRCFSLSQRTAPMSWRTSNKDENIDPVDHRGLQDARMSQFSRSQPPNMEPDSLPQQRYMSGQSFETSAPAYPGVPVHEYGCSSTTIGEKCTFATKIIAFSVPTNVPGHIIRSFFENFGPVRHISQPSPNTSLQVQEGFTHLYIDFVHSYSARKCLQLKDTTWLGGLKLQVEVAKEHWDPQHSHYVPRAHDGTPTGPPMRAVGAGTNAAVGQRRTSYMQPVTEHAKGDGSTDAASTLASFDNLEQPTPSESGPSSPKAKSQKKNKSVKSKTPKNKSSKIDAPEESLSRSLEAQDIKIEMDAQTRERRDENTVTADADTVVDSAETPVDPNRIDFVGAESRALPKPSYKQIVQAGSAEVLVKLPPTANVQPSAECQPLAVGSSQYDRCKGHSATVASIVDRVEHAKADAALAEESFHTDENTPDGLNEPSAGIQTGSVLCTESGCSDSRLQGQAVAGEEMQPPKVGSESAVAVPDLTSSPKASRAGSDVDDGQSSRPPVDGGAKPKSLAPPSTDVSVTLPTPAQQVVSKKAAKIKGVAQTESLNPFGKTKKTKTKKTPASRKVTEVVVQLPKPDLPHSGPRKVSKQLSVSPEERDVATAVSSPSISHSSKSADNAARTQDESGYEVRVENYDAATGPTGLAGRSPDTKIDVQSPTDIPSVIDSMGDPNSRPISHDGMSSTTEDVPPSSVDLGGAVEQEIEAAKKTKNKKKKKCKSKEVGAGQAEIVAFSMPADCRELSRPIFESTPRVVTTEQMDASQLLVSAVDQLPQQPTSETNITAVASPQTSTPESSQKSPRKEARVIGALRRKSSHILEASPSRMPYRHKRATSSKTSEASHSSDDYSKSNPERVHIIFLRDEPQDEISKSRERFAQLDLQQKELKAAKEAATEAVNATKAAGLLGKQQKQLGDESGRSE